MSKKQNGPVGAPCHGTGKTLVEYFSDKAQTILYKMAPCPGYPECPDKPPTDPSSDITEALKWLENTLIALEANGHDFQNLSTVRDWVDKVTNSGVELLQQISDRNKEIARLHTGLEDMRNIFEEIADQAECDYAKQVARGGISSVARICEKTEKARKGKGNDSRIYTGPL